MKFPELENWEPEVPGTWELRNLGTCLRVSLISGSFNVLGINMSADLSNIWEINLTKKPNEIRSLLTRWGRRPLSITGRITVIKSLAL